MRGFGLICLWRDWEFFGFHGNFLKSANFSTIFVY